MEQDLSASLEASLMCPICYEFVSTAMTISSCQHTYCSECIRRSLTFKAQCPSCRVTFLSSDLIRNKKLDEIITTWKKLREWISFSHHSIEIPNSNTIECQSCKLQINQDKVEQHNIICPASTRESPPHTVPQAKATKRYHIPYYKAISDKKIRTMLQEKGIVSSGKKPILIKRHREFLLQCTIAQDNDSSGFSEREIAEKVNVLYPTLSKKKKSLSFENSVHLLPSKEEQDTLFDKLRDNIYDRASQKEKENSNPKQIDSDTILLDNCSSQTSPNNRTIIISPNGPKSQEMQAKLSISPKVSDSASPILFQSTDEEHSISEEHSASIDTTEEELEGQCKFGIYNSPPFEPSATESTGNRSSSAISPTKRKNLKRQHSQTLRRSPRKKKKISEHF